jgi:hypothetical protein
MAQLGRIGGPLLADNLLRNGSDLAVDTKLLYLNVTGKYVGIGTSSPTSNLNVAGTAGAINTPTLNVTTLGQFGNLEFTTNQIQNIISGITISPNQASNPTITAPVIKTNKLTLSGNTIVDYINNDNISISPIGAGNVYLNNNTTVTGDLHATGNITLDGNITLGNQTTDTITITAEVNSNILPITTNTYSLGSNSLHWKNIYGVNILGGLGGTLAVSSLNPTNITGGNILFNGNTISNASADTILSASSGSVILNNNFKFNGNTLTMLYSSSANSTLTFNNIANGYLKFTGSNGVVLPVGTSTGASGRPGSPEVGATRYNSTISQTEVYDGTLGWIPAIGTSPVLAEVDVTDIMNEMSLIFG